WTGVQFSADIGYFIWIKHHFLNRPTMKTAKIILMCLIVLSTLSCQKDLLNTVPKDRLASNLFWKTTDDAIYAVNGIYATLGNQWRYSSMDAFTDIAH